MSFIGKSWSLIRLVALEANRNSIARQAGGLAFFALLGLPALLLLLLVAGGAILGDAEVKTHLLEEVEQAFGTTEAEAVAQVIEHTPRPGRGALTTQILSFGALLFGATAMFRQLQGALNGIWGVRRRRKRRVWWRVLSVVSKRFISFAMFATTGLLLLAMLGATALADALPDKLLEMMPADAVQSVTGGLETVVAFLLLSVHFALTFKVLPDAHVPWRGVILGALLTAALLLVGKEGLQRYLQASDLATPFGAAGSLVMTLIWFYATALAVLVGAVFTRSYERWRALIGSEGATT